MESLFGKMKGRPRQSSVSNQDLNDRSVPYHKLAPPQRSPVAVGTVSQGLRGNPANTISAPMTNPTLTSNGTELNKYAIARQRHERERAYRDASPHGRPGSPSMSISTADSSTLYNDSEGSSKATARRYRQSESGSSSMTDFGMQSPTSPSSRHRTLLSDHPSRPVSTATTMTQRSDDKRSSRYAASLSSHDSHHHLSSISAHLSRYSGKEEFNYPRPANDEEIEVLFEQVRQTRGLGELPGLTTDQKWQMVHSDEQLKWKEERQREEQARKQVETGQPAVLIDGTPEFYIKKFMDSTITAKQAGSLLVSLRGKEVRCATFFVARSMFVDVQSQLVPAFY